ncbi:MAG: class I SAM-dependent methyltransferase [bacterium]|nr:class I SAM-dependent methyltransferase [bacterium]
MTYTINNTSSYHINEMETLGWELTVCNSLEPEKSPCRDILNKSETYGNLLYNYLSEIIDLAGVRSVLEVGGGYGYITRDFLRRNPKLKASMLDISPYLLEKQKETLTESGLIPGSDISFIEKDFFLTENSFLKEFDMALLNENIGDFPTITGIDREEKNPDTIISKIQKLIKTYDFSFDDITDKNSLININTGAIEAVEKLCTAGISNIFISEHSCEACTPEEYAGKLDIVPTGNPERISLKGHDEYTIKFSFLEQVAKSFGYSVKRGQFADFIKFDLTPKLNFILTSHSEKDEHEIIRQFVDDIFKYEYLVLMRL